MWALGIRLGVPAYIAPLVAPAVDLSVVALLVGTRQLALAGASLEQIQPARRLLSFCSLVTLALNTAEPIIEGHHGRAAFDAVGCCLLIGWSHIGPELLQALQVTAASSREQVFTSSLREEPRARQATPVSRFRWRPATTCHAHGQRSKFDIAHSKGVHPSRLFSSRPASKTSCVGGPIAVRYRPRLSVNASTSVPAQPAALSRSYALNSSLNLNRQEKPPKGKTSLMFRRPPRRPTRSRAWPRSTALLTDSKSSSGAGSLFRTQAGLPTLRRLPSKLAIVDLASNHR